LQVGGAIETAKPEAPVDVMMGIGGTPEVGVGYLLWLTTNLIVVIPPADPIVLPCCYGHDCHMNHMCVRAQRPVCVAQIALAQLARRVCGHVRG
jgi:hypothetical protein